MNTGVNTPARLTISSTWATSTTTTGVAWPTVVRTARATTMPKAPGTTSGRLP